MKHIAFEEVIARFKVTDLSDPPKTLEDYFFGSNHVIARLMAKILNDASSAFADDPAAECNREILSCVAAVGDYYWDLCMVKEAGKEPCFRLVLEDSAKEFLAEFTDQWRFEFHFDFPTVDVTEYPWWSNDSQLSAYIEAVSYTIALMSTMPKLFLQNFPMTVEEERETRERQHRESLELWAPPAVLPQ